MMRCRTGERARPPSGGLPERGSPYMQQPIGNVQPEQWSWILSTLWSWIWAGLSWIVDWQAKVFHLILGADSFWALAAGALLLLLPATALVAGVLPARHRVRHRGDDLHVHASPGDERAAGGPDGLRGERRAARGYPVGLLVRPDRRQLRLHPGAQRRDQDSTSRADRLHGAGRDHRGVVRGVVPLPGAGRCHYAVARATGGATRRCGHAGARVLRLGGRSRDDVVSVRPLRGTRAHRPPGAAGVRA